MPHLYRIIFLRDVLLIPAGALCTTIKAEIGHWINVTTLINVFLYDLMLLEYNCTSNLVIYGWAGIKSIEKDGIFYIGPDGSSNKPIRPLWPRPFDDLGEIVVEKATPLFVAAFHGRN